MAARSLSLSTLLALRRGGIAPAQDLPSRGPAPIIWIHAGSRDREPSARALAAMLATGEARPGLVLSGVSGSGSSDASLLWSGPAPDDLSGPVRAFLDHWQPRALVWLGGALRPVLLASTDGRLACRILADAGAADLVPQAAGWLPGLGRSLLQSFDRLIVRDRSAEDRLLRQGVLPERIELGGRLDPPAEVMPCNEAERRDLAATIGARPVWFAAQVPLEEIPEILAAVAEARRLTPRLLCILSPRDPADAPAFAAALAAVGFRAAQRAAGDEPEEAVEVYVVDQPRELGLWYRLATLSYLGGSLSDGICPPAGHATALGSVVIYGRRILAGTPLVEKLTQAGAARSVISGADLGRAVELLLQPDRAAAMAHAAWDVSTAGAAQLSRIEALVRPALAG